MTRYLLLLPIICALSCKNRQADTGKEQFVEIRGKKQFYLRKGAGDPAVIFITGLGPTMDDFQDIQAKISESTATVCYDRAGIGKSESYNNERDLENLSSELTELIDKIGIDHPFLLVAHSRGGLIARYFIDKYPERVCGLLLIDPAIPELKWKKKQLRPDKERVEFDQYYDSFCTDSTKYSATIRNEFRNSFTTDSSQIHGKGFPRNIPITLIASTKISGEKYSTEEVEIKVELLHDYISKNPQIKLILTDRSGHYIYDTEPELVTNEILSMLNKIRKNK